MSDRENRIVEGSGNVFADLGLPDAEEMLVGAELTHVVLAELRTRRLTPAQTAHLLSIEETEAAALLEGRFVRFPTERLLHFLTCLGHDVDIVVRPVPAPHARARLRVVSAAA